ncbi:heavy metal-associated isoprenylated plant protein 36-like [Hibiscus syriacus]|uniref:heavy metal-associated isoprenylated plant protein 36-like n=1 Tax=Hibiscus syriacus TaxID=106335 RepID=UPI0019204C42|nr:heavy metal-associated isoprenylated plant protein 36-like [Hibiscus syriacus]
MKNGKMIRGFMCQSTSVNTACMAVDPRSIVMPRRLDRLLVDDHGKRSLNNARYSRLVESGRFVGAGMKRPIVTTPFVRKEQNQQQKPKHLHQPVQVASSELVFQVVVMRVSIHCQGCAGKVKKHLSKMEGVTSFSIDVESKRVTVMGHVSPAGVLESISKVKKAEFWPC